MPRRYSAAMAGKYGRLSEHLRALQETVWRASFAEIEEVLGLDLPASARSHAAWWSNGGHSHARAWLDAGFKTSELDLSRQTVVFRRTLATGSREPIVRPARRRVAHARMSAERPVAGPSIAQKDTVLPLCGRDFAWVTEVELDAGPDGRPLEFMPQKNYAKADEKPLNRHGHGPFCRFSVPDLPACPGLYAVTVDRRLAYVGIATDLQRRWGSSGYAKIQPVNCYRGGQSTNCKINHAILLAVLEEQIVELWTRRDSDPRPLEGRLIRELDPPWNDQP